MNTESLYAGNTAQHFVLNPQLYQRLASSFQGEILIANQGETMQTGATYIHNGHPRTHILHAGEYYRVNCPFCPDTKHRLWVNYMYGQTNAATQRPMKFLAHCYKNSCLNDPANWKEFDDSIFGFLNADQRRNSQPFPLNKLNQTWDETPNKPCELPGQVIPMSQLAQSMPQHPAVQYLMHGRRYTLNMLNHYDIGYCVSLSSPEYAPALNRLIFPVYFHGQLVGWQSREVPREYGPPYSGRGPKYWNLPKMKKRYLLYNYDNAVGKPFIVVCEGVTHVHRVGDNCVALFGKAMTQPQFLMIMNTWPNVPIVLILDPDAEDEMVATLDMFRRNHRITVPIHLPPGYDCSDYDKSTLWNIIHAQSRQQGVILPT